MKDSLSFKISGLLILVLVVSLLSAGCMTRTYTVVKERPDQEVSTSIGNQGYLMGTAPEKDRTIKTRDTYVVEVEMGGHKKGISAKTNVAPVETSAVEISMEESAPTTGTIVYGDYNTGSSVSSEQIFGSSEMPAQEASAKSSTYVVKKGDTLQRIAKEIYGSQKDWYKIYKANKEKLKKPDKIYVGQVLQIPE